MGEADCTLLIDAAVEAGSESVFLPSKLVDYLGAGKPVIAVTPPEGASARVTREAGGVVCDVGDADAIEALLADLAAGTRPAPLDREAVRGYHYEAVAGRLVDVIRDTVK
jgi:glycosyltransferase involved in cell wall biosynthesis